MIYQEGKPINNPQGVITFCSDTVDVQGTGEEQEVSIPVLRRNGLKGEVSCKYRTEKWTALPCYHYEEVKDEELFFAAGVDRQEVVLKIHPILPKHRIDRFQVVLDELQ